jgi:hypothetical protein
MKFTSAAPVDVVVRRAMAVIIQPYQSRSQAVQRSFNYSLPARMSFGNDYTCFQELHLLAINFVLTEA